LTKTSNALLKLERKLHVVPYLTALSQSSILKLARLMISSSLLLQLVTMNALIQILHIPVLMEAVLERLVCVQHASTTAVLSRDVWEPNQSASSSFLSLRTSSSPHPYHWIALWAHPL